MDAISSIKQVSFPELFPNTDPNLDGMFLSHQLVVLIQQVRVDGQHCKEIRTLDIMNRRCTRLCYINDVYIAFEKKKTVQLVDHAKFVL